MCHRRLHIELGRTMTIITGSNGSGKSAIMTAIMVALGNDASSTGRSGNLEGLIYPGAPSATVRIRFRNAPSNGRSFRHGEYGDEIVLERRISRRMSPPGRVRICQAILANAPVADEPHKYKLNDRIVDYRTTIMQLKRKFLIQPANPVAMMPQDTCRDFMKTTDPKKLYKYFKQACACDEKRSMRARCRY